MAISFCMLFDTERNFHFPFIKHSKREEKYKKLNDKAGVAHMFLYQKAVNHEAKQVHNLLSKQDTS